MNTVTNFLKNGTFKTTLTAAAVATICSSALANDMPGEGVEVTPIFPSIAEERFRGEIAMAGLEALGYEVEEPKESEYATMLLALSYGDADFTVHLWDKLHDTFYEKAGGDDTMLKVGSIMPGVLQGYQIDKKTADQYGITSLEDLKKPEIAKLFDSNDDGKADLTGCNPGWGCELVIDHHIEAYGLGDWVTHNRGSYFALMADTIARYQDGKPVLYFTWVPQWIAGVLKVNEDVVWLEVPYTDLPGGDNDVITTYKNKNLGFAVDEVMSVVNRDFGLENPSAMALLSQVQISSDDESAQNLKMRNGENSQKDIKRHAQEWISEHQAEFNGWLDIARQASN
ncbi:glycine betaine/L-proline ABC transporter substrate-binding protein ProX [Marinomonas atlantica]|uniref:glycine betaine/L-proline ABC transporter substrate-binding protein ProX n=1 Tax=Marinomonas atlantica TaxID=1806668 RepID=UPI0009EE2B1D|nr:glycine betaine/L-proline ABC transporter substrate-binding protein ProX [Marinomonas atlantica]MCO4786981.1 glycine betaine/L-proline ABC transporter substrate-binding protein ProX [Marinomonas atlantica]